MNLDLTGKLALVTGSTRGIGLATATGLAQMGAEVIVSGREEAAVTEAMAKIRQSSPSARTHAAAFDLGSADGCAALVARFPEVDILVNNLGIYEPKAFFEIEDADWAKMFDVNVMSGVRLTRHYLKRMLDGKDWGRVVFVSSESAVYVPKEMVHYGFSKAAQLYIARGVLYVQLAQYDEAEADFEKADALDPRQSIGSTALGLEAVQKKDLDQALGTIRSKLEKKPNDPYLLYLQADILSQKNGDAGSSEFQAALRLARKAVALKPTLGPAHDLLGKLYLQAGQNREALSQCRKAVDINPKDQTALYHLIQAIRKTEDKSELPDLLKRLAQLRQETTKEEEQRSRYKLIVGNSLSPQP